MINPLSFMIALIRAILTDPIVLPLFVGCVVLGLVAHSALLAIAVFFLMYSVQRTVLQLANALGLGLRALATELRALVSRQS